MTNIIKPKRKYTTGAPIASDLEQGEIAINLFDKTIYSKNNNNIIVLLSSLNGSSTEKFKVANAVANYDAVNKGQLDVALSAISSIPAGTIITFASSTPPIGYLKANGALLSRSVYSNLFSAIGTTFGTGDGSTTFALPDLRGYFSRAWDDGRGIDTGRVFGSNQADELKNHSHPSNTNITAYAEGRSNNAFGYAVNAGTTGTTGGEETRPKNIALLYCIKY